MQVRLKTGAGAWTVQLENNGVMTGKAVGGVLQQRFPHIGVGRLNPNHGVEDSKIKDLGPSQ